MQGNGLPLLSYPTSILFVDSDESFLNTLSYYFDLTFPTTNFLYEYSPTKAVELLNSNFQHQTFWDAIKITKDGSVIWPENFFKTKGRFEKISTVFMDYSMPEGSGVEHYKQIKSKTISRVVFTGYDLVDNLKKEKEAGYFDEYLGKHQIGEKEVFETIFGRMQNDFFKKLTQQINNKYQVLSNDELLIEKFNQLLKNHNIVEYYMLNIAGEYLLINDLGKCFILNLLENMHETIQIKPLISHNNRLPNDILTHLDHLE